MHTGTVIMVLTALGIPPVCLFGHEVGREVWACSGVSDSAGGPEVTSHVWGNVYGLIHYVWSRRHMHGARSARTSIQCMI